MKRTILSLIVFTAFIAVSPAQSTGIIADVLRQSVEQKVTSMQKLIQFDDLQAKQLYELELNYLFDVRKAENCKLCNKKKRIEKLQQKRDDGLQKILERDQYIKYQSLENDLLNENNRLWLDNEKPRVLSR